MKNYLITKNYQTVEEAIIDQLFSFPFSVRTNTSKGIMKTDILEYENEYKMYIDLPSVSKENIEINLEDSYLTVSAKSNKEEGKYLYKERYTGEYKRSYYVGELVKDSDIEAEFTNGTLIVTVKKVVKENNKKNISIN